MLDARGADGVALLAIQQLDNSGCVELLRGSVVSWTTARSFRGNQGVLLEGDLRHGNVIHGPAPAVSDELTHELGKAFGASPSFVQNLQRFGTPFMESPTSKHNSDINHWVGNIPYDSKYIVGRDCDRVEAVVVRVLQCSGDLLWP